MTGALVATLTQAGHTLVTQVHHTAHTHTHAPTSTNGLWCLYHVPGVCLRAALCDPAALPPPPSTGTATPPRRPLEVLIRLPLVCVLANV